MWVSRACVSFRRFRPVRKPDISDPGTLVEIHEKEEAADPSVRKLAKQGFITLVGDDNQGWSWINMGHGGDDFLVTPQPGKFGAKTDEEVWSATRRGFLDGGSIEVRGPFTFDQAQAVARRLPSPVACPDVDVDVRADTEEEARDEFDKETRNAGPAPGM